jgi:hypothetical protein
VEMMFGLFMVMNNFSCFTQFLIPANVAFYPDSFPIRPALLLIRITMHEPLHL